MPRHWHLHPPGPTHSLFGCAEREVGRLQSYGKQRILGEGNAEHHQVPERPVLSIPLGTKFIVGSERAGAPHRNFARCKRRQPAMLRPRFPAMLEWTTRSWA